MHIAYAPTETSHESHLWEFANHWLDDCRKWHYTGRYSAKTLLFNIGKISHLLANMFPVIRGNAGIMGWIQHGIALARHVQLGDYSQRTDYFDAPDKHQDTTISWDFMALVTPDIEEYANWFADFAFIDYVVC